MHEKAENLNTFDDIINQEWNKLMEIDAEKSANKDLFPEFIPQLNRFNNTLPYTYNSIKLGKEKKRYINASYIFSGHKGGTNFIATQGPKQETIDDFWTMVYQCDLQVIVMLCKLKENNIEKCAKYWDLKTNNYEIKIKEKIINNQDYIINKLEVKNKSTKEKKNVYHIQYLKWPDFGVPEDGKVFDVFREINKKIDLYNINPETNKKYTVLVHCTAGVGRTGTFISIYLLEKEIMEQINNKNQNIRFNIFNLVRKLKEMRVLMVQTKEQYKFIYQFVRYLLEKENL